MTKPLASSLSDRSQAVLPDFVFLILLHGGSIQKQLLSFGDVAVDSFDDERVGRLKYWVSFDGNCLDVIVIHDGHSTKKMLFFLGCQLGTLPTGKIHSAA